MELPKNKTNGQNKREIRSANLVLLPSGLMASLPLHRCGVFAQHGSSFLWSITHMPLGLYLEPECAVSRASTTMLIMCCSVKWLSHHGSASHPSLCFIERCESWSCYQWSRWSACVQPCEPFKISTRELNVHLQTCFKTPDSRWYEWGECFVQSLPEKRVRNDYQQQCCSSASVGICFYGYCLNLCCASKV